MPRCLPAVLYTAFLLLLSTANLHAQASGYASDPKFLAAMEEGKRFAQQHRFSFAADFFKKANKPAGAGAWSVWNRSIPRR